MRVLVDMDGPLANIELALYQRMALLYPDQVVLSQNRRHFKQTDDYPPHLSVVIRKIMEAPGFFRNLDLVSGAMEALEEMCDMGIEVMICTAPLSGSGTCASEKLLWAEAKMGPEWRRKVILTKDKTWVRGDFLIDDRPEVTGTCNPEWEHVLYTYPYNLAVTSKKRLLWRNWKEVLLGDKLTLG